MAQSRFLSQLSITIHIATHCSPLVISISITYTWNMAILTPRTSIKFHYHSRPYNYDVDAVMNLSTTLKNSNRKTDEVQKTTSKPTFLSIENYFDYLDSNNEILNEINDEPIKTVYNVNNQIEKPQIVHDKTDFGLSSYVKPWDELESVYYVSSELDDKPFLEYEDKTMFDIESHYYPKKPNTIKWKLVEDAPYNDIEDIRTVKFDQNKFEKSWPYPTRKKYQSFSKPEKYRRPYFDKYENRRSYFKKKPNYLKYKENFNPRIPNKLQSKLR